MRRLYFLLPNLSATHKVVDELLLARVTEKQIHVIAREGTELGDLPEASLIQKSDFIPPWSVVPLWVAPQALLPGSWQLRCRVWLLPVAHCWRWGWQVQVWVPGWAA